jgi:hypothetical protein
MKVLARWLEIGDGVAGTIEITLLLKMATAQHIKDLIE